jgi:hypothetical protein
VWGRGELCTGFWWENLRERDYLEDPGVDGRIILRWIFRNCDVGLTESVWTRWLLKKDSAPSSKYVRTVLLLLLWNFVTWSRANFFFTSYAHSEVNV